ncbi:NifB/NifX family molybdenum-iron cluster-binding protein [Thermococcus sp.]|uniref:NifB/NifX family molybdenum-iron cluster-binding protein n=1 Tax=Thermococcus sp. TaxID=35749 RepID=UPI00260DC7D5|nr:NifB/NifX family molybdenum-iron cluster-binding protein [Thermococcus sp.]
MRVAVPVEEPSFNSKVSEHFGKAKYVAVFLVTGRKLSGAELIELPEGHTPGELPALLKEKCVDVLLANRVGGRALSHFQALGIKVITGAEGRAIDVVRLFLKSIESTES